MLTWPVKQKLMKQLMLDTVEEAADFFNDHADAYLTWIKLTFKEKPYLLNKYRDVK